VEKAKLYLDEDITDLLARVLRTMGYDAVSAHEIKMEGRSDEDQLYYAIKNQRALLTCNVSHFTNLARMCYEKNITHYGIVVTPQLDFKEILRRVTVFLDNIPATDLKDRYIWL